MNMKKMRKVPFCDLRKGYIGLKTEIDAALGKAMSSGWYILGDEVRGFEKEFAAYCGAGFGVGVGSGTEALHIALLACGIERGDEVITVGNAGVPMIVAIEMAGAVPVFIDVDPGTYNMDVAKIEARITKRTKAVLPVHLYGQCVDMGPLLKKAKRYGLKVIEDACQAHGALYGSRKAGSMGDVGAVSFYPTKNLGGYGDGGMILTNNRVLAAKMRMLREYGQKEKYCHEIRGINSRLDEVQAAILRVKLKYLDEFNARRRRIAEIYDGNIKNHYIVRPQEKDYGSHTYHLYVISCARRDELQRYLAGHGIGAIIHYPKPVYRQKAYTRLMRGKPCPVTDRLSKTVLSLPLYPEIPEEDVLYVCDRLNGFRG